jgi:hypothetical protein
VKHYQTERGGEVECFLGGRALAQGAEIAEGKSTAKDSCFSSTPAA